MPAQVSILKGVWDKKIKIKNDAYICDLNIFYTTLKTCGIIKCSQLAYNDKRVIAKSIGPTPLGLFWVYPGTILPSLSALLWK